MSKDSPYSDWRAILLSWVVPPVERLLRASWGLVFVQFFLTISPGVPVDLRRSLGDLPARRLFSVSFGVTLFFCFFVTAFLCFMEGTLYGADPLRRYFVQDTWNIILYLLVCPTYVALSASLVALTIREWSALAEYADDKSGADERPRSPHRLYAVFFIAFLMCTFFIINYVHDALNQPPADATKARVYWFMHDLGEGRRALNRVGYYYVALNFSLLFVTLLGVACFLSLAAEVLRVGAARAVEKIDSFDTLFVKLESFTTAYLLTKCLAATYAFNFFVWGVSPLGRTDNLLVAHIALTVVGVFFVAVPRHYVELKWYELWAQSGAEFEFRETRPPKVKAVASFLDAFFISSLIGSWGLDLQRIAKWLGQ